MAIKMVIFEGILIGIIGSIIGIIIGIFATPPIVNGLFIFTDFRLQNVPYVIQPSTIILAFSIGSGVSFIISLFPALKTAKLDLIKSITPFRKEEEGWEWGPEKDANKKQHPCFVPYNQLPTEQQAKDFLFRQVVHSLKKFINR